MDAYVSRGSAVGSGGTTAGSRINPATEEKQDDIISALTGTGATNLGKAEDAVHSSGDVGVPALTVRKNTAAALSGTDGDYQPLITDTNGRLHVIDVNSAATTAGDVAHDAADSGNPVKVGGKAVNMDGTAPGTAVAENDRANFISDVYGRQCVETTHPNFWKATDNQSSAQADTALKSAPGSGLSLYITDIIISNGATAGNVKLVEDTGGTPVDVVEVMYFAINGGAVINLKTPIKLTANKDLGYTSVTVTTHSITVCGFIAP